jgi:hypothetical protein
LELIENRVTGVHNGNLIRTRFTNYGNLGHRTEKPDMEWPKGSGIEYGLEFCMFAGARIVDESMNQYFIFTESSSDPYNLDEDPSGTYTYSWEPLPGYYSTLLPIERQTIAMSNIPESWPRQWVYDYPGDPGTRDGMWNGEFKAAAIADQESFYAMVDWNNKESAYYPYPDDSTKGGLGLQVKVRTYQWADPLAEDILISIYDITNTSTKDLSNVIFGMYTDADVGGPKNDALSFDPTGDINITYQWDTRSSETGYFGFAFLESPGIDSDGLDNDDDLLVDESRASGRGVWLENDASPYIRARYGEPRSHWSGDEDGDWDVRYHDAGSDGLQEGEEEYPGPDSDGSEGNGLPDDGEPNFDRTDLDESDQIGLTSFTPAEVNWSKLKDDRALYNRTIPGSYLQLGLPNRTIEPKKEIWISGNAEFVYGSGYFPVKINQTERFSVSAVFGNNEYDILGNKAIMQQIYDDNYLFAKPPIKPTLYAYAKDKQVILSWDSKAEISLDPIYGHDFEGYILYKATDPEFNEIKNITDNHGNPFYYEPLAQFDLANGLSGSHPIPAGASITGDVDKNGNVTNRVVYFGGNGCLFYMGDDTGLQHHYIDNDVENGRTYYYAVVAYDKGYDFDFYARGLSDRNPRDGFKPRYPVQNSKTITQDVVGNIIFNDRNTAIVVPNAPAAGAEYAALDSLVQHVGPATGQIEVIITNPDSLKNGHRYRLTFTDLTVARQTNYYQIWDETENRMLLEQRYPEPRIVPEESILEQEYEIAESGLSDGMLILMENHLPTNKVTAMWTDFSGYLNTNPETIIEEEFTVMASLPKEAKYHPVSGPQEYADKFFPFASIAPSTIELTFFDHIVDTTLSNLPEYRIPVNFLAINVDEDDTLKVLAIDDLPFQTISDNTGIVLLKKYGISYYAALQLYFFQTGSREGTSVVLPEAGSRLLIEPSDKNFTSRDSYFFTVKTAAYHPQQARENLDQIAVVPDPYIAVASWEKPLYFTSGRGERRVDFIHLPPVCTIKIFSLEGKLICTLEHDSIIEDGHHSWDLTSKDGLEVAAGIYLYHVSAPGVGEKMGRFALIK